MAGLVSLDRIQVAIADRVGVTTKASTAIPLTEVALGAILLVGGALVVVTGEPDFLAHLDFSVGWVAIVSGGTLLLLAAPTHIGIRALHRNRIVGELEEGIEISQEILEKIQNCMSALNRSVENHQDLKLYHSQPSHYVFSFNSIPGLIFKMDRHSELFPERSQSSMVQRFRNMVYAKSICKIHRLGLLVIPSAKLFSIEHEGRMVEILAERKLDLNEKDQEILYKEAGDSLDKAVRQLAKLIVHAQYTDVEQRNNCVLEEADPQGNRKIALIDLEEMHKDRIQIGLFGGNRRTGLVGCVNEKQGQIVVEEAKRAGIDLSSAELAMKKRGEVIAMTRGLDELYENNGIETGKEPLQLPNQFNFSEYPPEDQEVLLPLTKALVRRLNDFFTEEREGVSRIQERRRMEVGSGDTEYLVGRLKGGYPPSTYKGHMMVYDGPKYLDFALAKLRELGLINNFFRRFSCYWTIQA